MLSTIIKTERDQSTGCGVKKLRNKVYRCYILSVLKLDALIFTKNCNLEGEANLLWWMQLVSRLWEEKNELLMSNPPHAGVLSCFMASLKYFGALGYTDVSYCLDHSETDSPGSSNQPPLKSPQK